jgi:hypothetical protein
MAIYDQQKKKEKKGKKKGAALHTFEKLDPK